MRKINRRLRWRYRRLRWKLRRSPAVKTPGYGWGAMSLGVVPVVVAVLVVGATRSPAASPDEGTWLTEWHCGS